MVWVPIPMRSMVWVPIPMRSMVWVPIPVRSAVWVPVTVTMVRVPATVVPVATMVHLLVEAEAESKLPGLHLGNEHAQCDFLVLCHPWAHLLHDWALDLVHICTHPFDLHDREAHHVTHR